MVIATASHLVVVELATSRASEGAGLSPDAAAFDAPDPQSAFPTAANDGAAVFAEMSAGCPAADLSTAESVAHAGASADMSASGLSTAKSTAHVAATESAAATTMTGAATTTTAAMFGGHGIRHHCCSKRDSNEEIHDFACDLRLLDAGR
jgi:hypothetical protein